MRRGRKRELIDNSSESFDLRLEFQTIFIGMISTGILVFFLFRLWGLNPHIPITYSGDTLSTLASLRNMRFGNWYWTTNKLGAPLGQDLRNFPDVANNLHLLILWLGIKIFRNEFLVFNGFFFGSYLLTTATGYIGSRMLRVQRIPALLIGIAYSFLPYHYLQGPNHLTLAAYWAIPLWVAFLLRELMDESISPFTEKSLNTLVIRNWICQTSTLALTTIAVLATSTGLYYGFFFVILSGFVIVVKRVGQSSKLQWIPVTWTFSVGLLSLAIQYFPIWNYHRIHGSNLSIVHRTIAEVEFYSLKLSNLLLPVVHHRVSVLDHFQQKSKSIYLIGEGTDSLGILGSFGFLSLVCILVFRLVRSKQELSTALATFTLMSIFTCIVGGMAQFLALFGFTQLRVMSRMSIVIAFPSIIFAVLLVTRLVKSWNQRVASLALTLLIVLSVLDTNPAHLLPPFEDTALRWRQDQSIVERLEIIAAGDSMVLQLPQVDFPEGSNYGDVESYDHLRGYLHSSSLKWSFGNIKTANQATKLITEPFDDSDTKRLVDLGFSFIWFNASGYGDSAEVVRNEIKAAGNQLEFSLHGIDIFRIGSAPNQAGPDGS